ncbi:ABC transporter ATP-binding/permease protein [Enhygromyxa salina]|uniref:ABC transporter ATP-binding/permease protein n=1 Tax=Enhygromyxa salina TaxID=215803 RepID=A0A2S9YLA8_9BACT|nr:FHA domain-containing protein [Enhygromyxa salina]PRQ05895.1 ABC transporter ATP-binding/permease protein [Enhygromyxa salina]
MSGQYRLKIGARTLKLPGGTVDVGRSSDCWLTLDDDLISRYHARFHVSDDLVVLEDLKSRNGTFVNGEQLDGKITLHHADKVRIGHEVITIVESDSDEDESGDALRRTIGPGEDSKFPSLIGALVEKSLSMGKLKEAERYALALTNQLASAKVPVDHPTAASAVNCLVALAEKTSGGVWLDRVFRLHAAKGWLMQASVITRVRSALDRIPRVPGSGLQDYETKLRAMSRDGLDVPAKLMAEVAEISDAYGKG